MFRGLLSGNERKIGRGKQVTLGSLIAVCLILVGRTSVCKELVCVSVCSEVVTPGYPELGRTVKREEWAGHRQRRGGAEEGKWGPLFFPFFLLGSEFVMLTAAVLLSADRGSRRFTGPQAFLMQSLSELPSAATPPTRTHTETLLYTCWRWTHTHTHTHIVTLAMFIVLAGKRWK